MFQNLLLILDGGLMDIIDNDRAWRTDQLPFDEINLPLDELPDPEADTDQISLKEQEEKWLDLALSSFPTETNEQLNNSNS